MYTGLSEVIGSWKIIEMSFPRMARISRSLSWKRSFPSKKASPRSMKPGGLGISLKIDSEVTLLPQPLSPTMPSVLPG